MKRKKKEMKKRVKMWVREACNVQAMFLSCFYDTFHAAQKIFLNARK